VDEVRSCAPWSAGVVLALVAGAAVGCGGTPANDDGGTVGTSSTARGVVKPDLASRTVAFHARHGRHTYTRAQLQPGDLVKCGLAGASVQPPGEGTGAFADGVASSSDLEVSTAADGTVTVDCSTG
jgi:hypothetical protein